MIKVHVVCSLFSFYVAHAMPLCYEKIEKLKSNDTTVVYAECIDSVHVLLFRSNYPDVLFFINIGNSVSQETDSIIDFNHGFTLYKNEDDLKMAMGEIHINDLNEKFRMQFSYASTRKYQLKKPLLGSFSERLYIVDYNSIYELSLSRRVFEKVMSYHLAMDLREDCSDSNITRLPNPKRIISSSAIKVSFQDGSDFMLSSDGSLNIHVVDTNSCLGLKGSYNNIQIDRVKGDGCKKSIPLCD